MGHTRSIAIASALATATLSAAPAAAMSILPAMPPESGLLLEGRQLIAPAVAAPGSQLQSASQQMDGGRHEQGSLAGSSDDGELSDRDGGWDRRLADNGSGGDDDSHHGRAGGSRDGEGTPQTVPVPSALPLLLSGLASLLTVARRRGS